MARLSVLTWIGNAAASLFGLHGAVTDHAHQTPCSRQTVYDHQTKVVQAVTAARLPGPSREALLQENALLKDEIRQLYDGFANSFDCPKEKRQQFAVAAAAMGLSLQQTLVLLAILLPKSLCPARPTLGRWVLQGAKKASSILKVLDAACRTLVLTACLDEIFFHRQPVLMAIEPYSMAWVLGKRTPDRSGPTWCAALAGWPHLQDVAADGGTGIELGLKLTEEARQKVVVKRRKRKRKCKSQPRRPEQSLLSTEQLDEPADPLQALPLRVRLDVFHIKREARRALRIEWSQTEALWEQAEKVARAKKRFDSKGIDRKQFRKDRVEKAWRPAEAAFLEVERKELAWQRIERALEIFREGGRLNDRGWAQAEIQAAAPELTGHRWAKTKRMLLDKRALTFLDRMHEELAKAEPCPIRREALAALWRWRRSGKSKQTQAQSAVEQLQGMWQALVIERVGQDGEQAYRKVSKVLREVVRASSAVECVNSVVRMHQARHRNLTQELIDLKRLYWNSRSFVGGKRKGRCPYQHLGVKLPTYDAWELLQMSPEGLKQKVSSSGVAA